MAAAAGRARACNALSEALAASLDQAVRVAGAGRTDAGVHALGQVAHVDLAMDWRTDTLRDAVNAHLRPQPVAVLPPRRSPTASTRGFPRGSATISTASSTGAPSCAGAHARLARAAPARCRRDARGRAPFHRQARFHHVSCDGMPGEIAGEDARPARRVRAGETSASRLRRARSCTVRSARWSAR